MNLLTPEHWKDYEMIDSGNFKKLEKFGAYVLSRPEPQAVWDKSMSDREWDNMTKAIFQKDEQNPDKGEWIQRKGMPGQWTLGYNYKDLKLTFRLGLSSFKHVGIFPEQAANWDYIYDRCKKINKPTVLNLFAYTGGATIAAKAGGADVVHVDSIKQVVTWANDNMALNNLSDIRWVIEDAMTFVKREVKRGKKYNGIMLDPPAYGRGPKGERWLLEEHLVEMLKLCKELLADKDHFLILNLYSLGYSALIIETLMKSIFGEKQNPEFGELYLEDKFQKKLPLGVYYRFSDKA